MNFCVAKITMDSALRADRGVVREAALAVTSNAQIGAQRILATAQAQADQIMQLAQQRADAIAEDAQLQSIEALDSYQAAFDAQYGSFLQRAQPLVIQLALGLFDQLVLSMTERERAAALVNRLVAEAPTKLTDVMLHLHPQDAQHLPNTEWPSKADATLAQGTAVLIASSGEWRMDLPLAVDTLKASLLRRQHEPLAN